MMGSVLTIIQERKRIYLKKYLKIRKWLILPPFRLKWPIVSIYQYLYNYKIIWTKIFVKKVYYGRHLSTVYWLVYEIPHFKAMLPNITVGNLTLNGGEISRKFTLNFLILHWSTNFFFKKMPFIWFLIDFHEFGVADSES